MTEASNRTKVTLYMGKKGFFGGFYPFPTKYYFLFVRLSNRLQQWVEGEAIAVRFT